MFIFESNKYLRKNLFHKHQINGCNDENKGKQMIPLQGLIGENQACHYDKNTKRHGFLNDF